MSTSKAYAAAIGDGDGTVSNVLLNAESVERAKELYARMQQKVDSCLEQRKGTDNWTLKDVERRPLDGDVDEGTLWSFYTTCVHGCSEDNQGLALGRIGSVLVWVEAVNTRTSTAGYAGTAEELFQRAVGRARKVHGSGAPTSGAPATALSDGVYCGSLISVDAQAPAMGLWFSAANGEKVETYSASVPVSDSLEGFLANRHNPAKRGYPLTGDLQNKLEAVTKYGEHQPLTIRVQEGAVTEADGHLVHATGEELHHGCILRRTRPS